MSQETEALKKDMEQLRRDLGSLADAVKRSSQQKVQAGAEQARARIDGACTQAELQTEQLGSHIKQRPFTSVLTAFGVGILLGKLIGR